MIRVFFILVLMLLNSSVLAAGKLPAFVAPKFMKVVIVSDNMVFNGMRMKSATFRASATLEETVAFYEKAWDDQIKETKVGRVLVLSHFDGKFLFVVQFDNRHTAESNTQLGLLSITKPGSVPANFKLGDGFPMLPSSNVINDIVTIDLGKEGRTLLLNNNRSIKDNLAFYRRKFTKKGWIELPREASKPALNTAALLMSKGGNELNMAFSRANGQTNVVAVVVHK